MRLFPVAHADACQQRIPESWKSDGVFFIPMYQREALWLGFDAPEWRPHAVKVGIGRINAISGEPWVENLVADPQDYVVCPPQLWLDGINAGVALVRQFVAMPLGSGVTVEGQLTGQESFGGIQLVVVPPKPDRLSLRPKRPPMMQQASYQMGIGVGGKVRQRIYPDPHGVDAWDMRASVRLAIHIINSEQYRHITGLNPPPSPIDSRVYSENRLPWFVLYDEELGDVDPAERLKNVSPVGPGEEPRRTDCAGVLVSTPTIRPK